MSAPKWDDAHCAQPLAVERLAEAFRDVLTEWLGTVGIAKVRRDNVGTIGSPDCASQDYCDANMAMDEAMRRTFGAGPLDGVEDVSDAATALWGAAWDRAKALYLTDGTTS